MKLRFDIILSAIVFSLSPLALYAQNPPSSQTLQTVECHSLKGGDFIGPDEFLAKDSNGQYEVCHVVKATKPAPQSAASAGSSPQPSNAAPQPIYVLTPVKAVKSAHNADGQGESSPDRPTARFGASFGYQYSSADLSSGGLSTSRANMNGGFMELMGNVTPYLSVVGKVDGAYVRNALNLGANVVTVSLGGGPQVYPIRHGQWSPFGRVLFGATYFDVTNNGGNETGFSLAFGGGFDYKPNTERRIGIRLGQLDYSKTWKQGVTLNMIKLGVGISF